MPAASGTTPARENSVSEHRRDDPSDEIIDFEGEKSKALQMLGKDGIGAFTGAGAGAGATPTTHDTAPAEDVMVAGQLVHTTAPAPEYIPGVQATQLVDPDALANKPAEQGAHKPLALEGSDVPAAEKVPGEQVTP